MRSNPRWFLGRPWHVEEVVGERAIDRNDRLCVVEKREDMYG